MKYILSAWFWFVGFFVFIWLVIIGNIALTFASARKIYPWYIKLFRIIFKVLFVRITVEKLEELDKNKAYLVMSNHVSFFDAPLFSAYPPCFICAIEAANHFKWPVYGRLVSKWGNIPINRESVRASLQSLNYAMQKLKEGNSILIFPEGHRTKDGQLQSFKKLPFLLAKQAEVGIVPVGLSGVYKFNKLGSYLVNPTKIKIKYGKIIPAETVAALSIDDLLELTKSEVKKLIERP